MLKCSSEESVSLSCGHHFLYTESLGIIKGIKFMSYFDPPPLFIDLCLLAKQLFLPLLDMGSADGRWSSGHKQQRTLNYQPADLTGS